MKILEVDIDKLLVGILYDHVTLSYEPYITEEHLNKGGGLIDRPLACEARWIDRADMYKDILEEINGNGEWCEKNNRELHYKIYAVVDVPKKEKLLLYYYKRS